MTSEPLPSDIPWYCIYCGAPLIYTEISIVAGEGSASWRCSGCGKDENSSWFDFTPCDQTEQSATGSDIEFKSFLPDYRFILPPQSPGGLTTPPPPSYFVSPEDARMVQEQLNREFREHGRRYENGGSARRNDADEVVDIVRAAHFPLFALNDLQGRFPFQSYGAGGWSRGKTPRMLWSFNLRYEGPSYPNVTERIVIEQEDEKSSRGSNSITDESQAFDADRVVRVLSGLPGGDEPDMHALLEGMAIYQYVNLETARRTPVVSASIRLQSGEVASWMIRRFNAPLSLAHAHANIEGTRCDVGAIGRAAEEIENLLGQLTRLTSESGALDQINRGLKARDEYFKRGFQS